MSLNSAICSILHHLGCFNVHDEASDEVNTPALPTRLLDAFLRTADLGFTSFGGPNVHFQIFHRRFVEGVGGRRPWIDEQTVGIFRQFIDMLISRQFSIKNYSLYRKRYQALHLPRCSST